MRNLAVLSTPSTLNGHKLPSTPTPRFDVILIDPPWEEYARRSPGFMPAGTETWTWQQIRDLKIEDIADTPSFVFL